MAVITGEYLRESRLFLLFKLSRLEVGGCVECPVKRCEWRRYWEWCYDCFHTGAFTREARVIAKNIRGTIA